MGWRKITVGGEHTGWRGRLPGESRAEGETEAREDFWLKNGIYLGYSELRAPLGPPTGLGPSLLPTPVGKSHLLCQALWGWAAQRQVPQRNQRHQGTAGTTVGNRGTGGSGARGDKGALGLTCGGRGRTSSGGSVGGAGPGWIPARAAAPGAGTATPPGPVGPPQAGAPPGWDAARGAAGSVLGG